MKNHENAESTIPKRWYERQPSLAEAITVLTDLPDPVTTIVGDSIITLANQEFKVMELKDSLRSIGSEKVMGMHKSKQRRRAYDHNPTLHKAINYIYVLPEPKQDKMANHVLNIVKYIKHYDTICKTYNATTSLDEITVITEKYVNSGSISTERFLVNMKEMLHIKTYGPPKDSTKDIADRLNNTLNSAKVDHDASKISAPENDPVIKPKDPTLVKERVILSDNELNAMMDTAKQTIAP